MPNLKVGSNKTPSLKQVTGARAAAIVGSVALLALFAPLIWAAVSAGVGLVVLMVIAAVGIGIFQTLPLFAQKWENKVLEMRKAEARKRPIETLQNYLKQKKDGVANFKSAVVQIGTQVRGMIDMVEDRKREKPDWDPSKKEKAIVQMKAAHQVLVNKYEKAERALVDLADVIEEKKFDWKFGEAGGLAIESLNSLNGEDLVSEILADEAFDAVRDNFNTVFSELELEATKLNSNKALSFDDGMTIDLSTIDIQMKTKVGA